VLLFFSSAAAGYAQMRARYGQMGEHQGTHTTMVIRTYPKPIDELLITIAAIDP
jgi:hypothetical protein